MKEKTYTLIFGVIAVLFTIFSLFNLESIVTGSGLIVVGITTLFMYARYETKKYRPDKISLIGGFIVIATGVIFILFG